MTVPEVFGLKLINKSLVCPKRFNDKFKNAFRKFYKKNRICGFF